MVQRSPLISAGLLLAPTICVVALRFGLPNIEELLKQDLFAQVIIHTIAIILGIIMYFRYRVVEDHEYHRSSAIKGLSSMYRLEDKGLWSRGDAALEKLESQASSEPRGRAGLRFQKRMSGRISDLNKEGSELELDSEDSRMDVDVQVEGASHNSDSSETQSEEVSEPTGALGPVRKLQLNVALQKNCTAEKSKLQKMRRRQKSRLRRKQRPPQRQKKLRLRLLQKRKKKRQRDLNCHLQKLTGMQRKTHNGNLRLLHLFPNL